MDRSAQTEITYPCRIVPVEQVEPIDLSKNSVTFISNLTTKMPLPPISTFFPHRPWASSSSSSRCIEQPIDLSTPSLTNVTPSVVSATVSEAPVFTFAPSAFLAPPPAPLAPPPAPISGLAPPPTPLESLSTLVSTLAPPSGPLAPLVVAEPDFFSPGYGALVESTTPATTPLSVRVSPLASVLPLAPAEEGNDLVTLAPPLVEYEDVSEPSSSTAIVEPIEWGMELPAGNEDATGFTPLFEQARDQLPSDFWSTVSAFFESQREEEEPKYGKRLRRAPKRFQSEPFPTRKEGRRAKRKGGRRTALPPVAAPTELADVGADAGPAPANDADDAGPAPANDADDAGPVPADNAGPAPANDAGPALADDAGPFVDASIYDFDE